MLVTPLFVIVLFIYVIVEIKLEFCRPAVFSGVRDQRERGKTSGHYGQHFCAGCRNVRRRFEFDCSILIKHVTSAFQQYKVHILTPL